jgi:hypothetical protein
MHDFSDESVQRFGSSSAPIHIPRQQHVFMDLLRHGRTVHNPAIREHGACHGCIVQFIELHMVSDAGIDLGMMQQNRLACPSKKIQLTKELDRSI